MNSRYLILLAITIAGFFAFQNCAKMGSVSESSKVDELANDTDFVHVTDGDQDLTNNEQDGGSGNVVTPSSPQEPLATACVDAENISIFKWTNSTSDPMTAQGAAVVGDKLATIKIDTPSASGNPFSGSAWPAEDVGWRISTTRTASNTGGTVVTAYMNKWSSTGDNDEYLTCSFGPVLDSTQSGCVVKSPEGKLQYQNIGVGLNGVDGFMGYLSCPQKYIACKLERTSKKIVFKNTSGQSLTLEPNTPFIIKRGCGN